MVVPIAAIGALSEAWFDALGLARHKDTPTAKLHDAPQNASTAKVTLPANALVAKTSAPRGLPKFDKKRDITVRTREIVSTRVLAQDKLRIQTELAAAHESNTDAWQRSAGRITIRSGKGTVRMLIQRDENRMRITAVCNPEIVGSINDALQMARLRLQSRGISVELQTVGENAA